MKNREANLGEVELPVQDANLRRMQPLPSYSGLSFAWGAFCARQARPVEEGQSTPTAVHANEEYIPLLSKNTKVSLLIHCYDATY